MNTLYFIILILILTIVFIKTVVENFSAGYGTSFGTFHQPQRCDPKDNCFAGTYLRSQQYHNVCPPKLGGLNREKIQLQDDCQRSLGNFPAHRNLFECNVDNHLRRHCRWKKMSICPSGCNCPRCAGRKCDCPNGNCDCKNCKCQNCKCPRCASRKCDCPNCKCQNCKCQKQ